MQDHGFLETRSIEFIPESERYGSTSRLFSIWFSSNMQVTALLVGALGVQAGLNVFWNIIAILLGTGIGTVFMAAHSAQGPHLGIPQMIQSRAQFGVYGAAVPLMVMVIAYVLFAAANAVEMRTSIQAAISLPDNLAIIVFGALTLVISFVGYELIHKIGVYMSFASGLLFLVVGCFAASHSYPPETWSSMPNGYHFQAFILSATRAASWSIGFAPFVADYTRYLPSKVKTSSTFWYSYAGQAGGASLIMILGAVLATYLPDIVNDPGRSVANLFHSGRWVAYLVIVLGVLEINVLCIYSCYMAVTTIFTGFHGIKRISRLRKFGIMALMTAVATIIAVATQYQFTDYFDDILTAQIYFIVPWTAVNLCDFYAIRFGRYWVSDIYDENGRYGKWNKPTLFICLVTVLAEIPFMELSFYTGPVAKIAGCDVTILISFFLPALLYYLLNRQLIVRLPAQAAPTLGG
jgi:NCS1 family nucleobase:cation symporter-1